MVAKAAQPIHGYSEHKNIEGPHCVASTCLSTFATVVQKMEMFRITKSAATNMDSVINGVRSDRLINEKTKRRKSRKKKKT